MAKFTVRYFVEGASNGIYGEMLSADTIERAKYLAQDECKGKEFVTVKQDEESALLLAVNKIITIQVERAYKMKSDGAGGYIKGQPLD